jgi:hypothetical protein
MQTTGKFSKDRAGALISVEPETATVWGSMHLSFVRHDGKSIMFRMSQAEALALAEAIRNSYIPPTVKEQS